MPNKNIRDLLREVPITNKSYPEYIEALAEHLEASGVLLPPCKVGQIVYSALSPLWDTEIQQFVIDLQNASQKASKIITDETAKYVKENHKYNNIIDYAKAHIKSRFEYEAEFLTELGYAKASEVAREIIDILKTAGIDEWRYPVIAELKKKYTEERE